MTKVYVVVETYDCVNLEESYIQIHSIYLNEDSAYKASEYLQSVSNFDYIYTVEEHPVLE